VEAAFALVYVALWGCVVPLGATADYCLFTRPRESHTSARIPRPRAKRTTKGDAAAVATVRPPRRQPGVPAPFVYGDDIPWGWLEHRAGRFQGLRLALQRSVISIGREEENEIWLDDETSSRYHAELAWQQGQVYVTDCDSLNGVILNGRRMRGTLPVNSGDLLEIGSHRFLFEIAPAPASLSDQDDPLLRHARRPSMTEDQSEAQAFDRNPASFAAPPTKPLHESAFADAHSLDARDLFGSTPQSTQMAPGIDDRASDGMPTWMQTLRPDPVTPPPLPYPPLPPARNNMCLIRSGNMAGQSFLLDRPVLTVGQASDCDVLLEDASITL
jgi:pSer/pThr/pTyr-binding forkhead associated (FHA) protein